MLNENEIQVQGDIECDLNPQSNILYCLNFLDIIKQNTKRFHIDLIIECPLQKQ